jgi:hypothetical protein
MHGSIALRDDYSAGELRKLARREKNGRVALRLTAIAAVLEGASRKDAASRSGMDRQTLCALRQAQEGPPVQREGA